MGRGMAVGTELVTRRGTASRWALGLGQEKGARTPGAGKAEASEEEELW